MNGLETKATDDEEFIRLPGLYRRWEFDRVIEPGTDFRVEEAGMAEDGTPLFAMYRREPDPTEESVP